MQRFTAPPLNDILAQSTADAINNGTITLDSYIAQELTKVAATTQAAVAISAFVTGKTPTAAKLDALQVDAQSQFEYYTKMGAAIPALGAYEAFGVGFSATAEFAAKYGAASTADFINGVYTAVFGVAPSAGAFANFTSQITYFTDLYLAAGIAADVAAAQAKGAVLGQIVGYAFVTASSADSNLDNQVANALTAAAKGDASVYDAPLAGGSAGLTFVLTTGADTGAAFTGTAGNDTYEAGVVMAANGTTLINTLQNIDSLNGGAGIDTLNVTLNGGAAKPVLTSVEVVNLRSTAFSDLDLSASTGVTNVNVANSTATSILVGIGNAAVGVANQSAAVSIKGSTATALSLNLDTVGTKTTDIAFDLADGVANAATSLAITAKDARVTFAEATASAATTSASIAATGANRITFGTADLASLTSVAVSGAGSVELGGNLSVLKTLTAGDGGVKATITNATANTVTVTTGGGADTITVVGAGVKNISTGAGNDTVSTTGAALAATAVVDLGAGDDSLTLSAAFAAGATLSGGDGTDTLGMAKADYATVSGYSAANLAKVTDFEVLSISDALANSDSIDLSKIAGLVSFKAAAGISNGATASVVKLGANASVELAGDAANNGTLNVSLKNDTGSDSLTLVLNKNFAGNNDTTSTPFAASHNVAAADIESLIVNSTGKNTGLPFTPVDGYKADTITNTLDLTGSNKLTDITVTGDQALVLASTAAQTKLATVDASANTGGLSFNGSLADMTTPTTSVAMSISGSLTAANAIIGTGHADTIVGGAGRDTITGGKGGDMLTGNGGNDVFVFAAGDSSIGTGKFDTITDFVANTKGTGVNGAQTSAGATGVVADLNGDTLQFKWAGSGTGGVVADALASAADAITFLATNKGLNTVVAALDVSTNNLYVDNTGDGVADFFIHLVGVSTLDTGAFTLVA